MSSPSPAKRSFRLPLLAAAVAFTLACGGASTGPVSIAGNWNLSDVVTYAQGNTSCNTAAVVTIVQSGSSFTGSVTSGTTTCSGPSGVTSTSLAGGTLSAGEVSGTSVSFTDNRGCSYTGALTGNPATPLAGNVTCTLSVPSGGSQTFTGTWQFSR